MQDANSANSIPTYKPVIESTKQDRPKPVVELTTMIEELKQEIRVKQTRIRELKANRRLRSFQEFANNWNSKIQQIR